MVTCEEAYLQQREGQGLTTHEAVAKGMCVTIGSVHAIEAVLSQNRAKHGQSRLQNVCFKNPPVFSFGNSTENKCLSTASLEVQAGGAPGVLNVHTLDHGQSPVLLSIDTLRRLGAIIDFNHDLLVFRNLDPGKIVRLARGKNGHQLLPLTDDWLANAETATQAVPSLKSFLG